MGSVAVVGTFYVAVTIVCSAIWLAANKIRGVIVSEVQDAVDVLTAQVTKSYSEIVSAIAELEAREPSVDLSALKAAVQSVDDIVADAPVEEPVSE